MNSQGPHRSSEFVVPYGDRIMDLRIYLLSHSASFHAAWLVEPISNGYPWTYIQGSRWEVVNT